MFEGWKIRRLLATATVHESLAEIFPGDSLYRSRVQLRCTAFKLGQPDGLRLGVFQFKAVEQPRRHLSPAGFV